MSKKPKQQSDNDSSQPNIIINNNSGGKFSWWLVLIVAIVSIIIGIFARQALDLSNIFEWWTAPASIDIADDIYIPDVEHIRSMAELTTTRYNYADVIAGQSNMPAWLSRLYGDSVVMVAVGTIEAGIDFSQLSAENIVYDATAMTLNVTLPTPVLQNCFLDERKSYVVERNTAVFADTRADLEDTVRQEALLYYRDQAIEEGILSDAETAAQIAIGNLVRILLENNDVDVIISFAEPPEEPILPDNCQ